MVRNWEGCQPRNPNPKFQPPASYLHSISDQNLPQTLVDAKVALAEAESKHQQARKHVSNAKQLHYTVRRMLKKLEVLDIFKSDALKQRIGRPHLVREERRKVVNEILKAVATFHNILDGYLHKSSITSLSDQIGITTYGQKRYGDKAKWSKSEDDTWGKKKAISRASRAIDNLVSWGVIAREYLTCPITGKNIPTLLRVTPLFYQLLQITPEELDKIKADRIEFLKYNRQLPADYSLDDLEQWAETQRKTLIKARQLYAQAQRRRNSLNHRTAAEIHEIAQNEVIAHTSPERLKQMPPERYKQLVSERVKNLYYLRSNPDIPDHFWADKLTNYATGFIH